MINQLSDYSDYETKQIVYPFISQTVLLIIL